MPITYNVASSPLLQLNSYKESSWGTAGSPASAKWLLIKKWPELKAYRKATVYDEIRGSLAPGWTNSILRNGGEWKIPGYLTFEDSILLGQALFGIITATGGSPSFGWNYNAPTTTQPSLQSYTFEFNQPSFMVLGSGCIANKAVIKGAAEQWIDYELSGFAKDIDAGTPFVQTALSDRVVEPLIMPNTALFLDWVGGSAIGTTAFAAALIDFTLTLENSLNPLYTAGNLQPTQVGAKQLWKTDLELNLAYIAAVKTFFTGHVDNGDVILAQFKTLGSGTKSLIFNFTGVLSDDPPLFGEKNGFQSIKFKLSGQYDSGASMYAQMNVVNPVGTVP